MPFNFRTINWMFLLHRYFHRLFHLKLISRPFVCLIFLVNFLMHSRHLIQCQMVFPSIMSIRFASKDLYISYISGKHPNALKTGSCIITCIQSCVFLFFLAKVNGSLPVKLFTYHTHPGPLSTFRMKQNGRHRADAIFKCIFLFENYCILIPFSLKFVPWDLNDDMSALV